MLAGSRFGGLVAPGESPGRCPCLGRHGRPAPVRRRAAEPLAGADAELSIHIAKVPFDGAWANEQVDADLRVGVAFGCEPHDLRLLRREIVARLDGALSYGLARSEELAAGALGEPAR